MGQSMTPRYQVLATELKKQLADGVYPVHSKIPSEHTLGAQFHVSRVTVRKALEILEGEGLLERIQGSGTFVSSPRIEKNLLHSTSFHDTCRMMGVCPSTRVIDARMVEAGERDRKMLQDALLQTVFKVTRLCLADNEPVMLEKNTYAPLAFFLEKEDLSGSIYALLCNHGVIPDRGSHAIALRYADAEDARLLNVSQGEALLEVSEAILARRGLMIHYSIQHVRGDRYTFRI